MRTKIEESGRAILILAAFIFVINASGFCAEEAKSEAEWKPLFNGKDLTGWKMTGPGEFTVEDGELVTHGGMGLLWYERERIGNAELRIVFQTTKPDDNSGIFIRIDGEPADPWFAVHHGYEVQIDNGGDESHRTGALYSLTKVKEMVQTKPGEDVTVLIKLVGDRTIVHVNGKLVTDFTEGDPVPPKKASYEPDRGPRPETGYIGLQNHDDKSRVHFKEISMRPLKTGEYSAPNP